MSRFLIAVGVVGLLSLSACGADDKKPDDAKTGIRGAVTIQYLPGVPGAEIPPPKPATGLKVRVRGPEKDDIIKEGKTDEKGKFQINLPPGDYRVEVEVPAGANPMQPLKVTVKDGAIVEMKKVELVVALP